MPIRVLPQEVASKIAAGEVVERPASVVKELVENALDAGAHRIAVEVRRGGVELVRVVDDGVGIPADQVELAFQRYATSKVAAVEDLGAVKTLGFRGEALPSIAAVASVTMVTRTAEAESGRRIELQDGRVLSAGPYGAPPGTSVTVRGLFRHFPARRKFLRSPGAEASRIQTLVTRYALAYPHVRFSLTVDGREAFASPGNGQLRDVLAAVFGAEVAAAMLEVGEGDAREGVRVSGFVSPPSLTRANRGHIALFVNGRWVQSRALVYALEQAYHGFLMERRYPLAALFVALPLDQVDVNVHPAKAEVRFLREDAVFAAVQRAVRAALVGHAPVPEVRRPPTPTAEAPARPVALWPTAPVARGGGVGTSAKEAVETPGERLSPSPRQVLPALRVLGQLQNTYIVAEGVDGMYLVDQHAAHERVLFEQTVDRARRGEAEVQALLEPATVELDPRREEVLRQHGELVRRVGFRLEPFGEGTYLLRGLPALLRTANPPQVLQDVLDLMAEGGGFETWEERAAYSIACHGAIRAGMALGQEEMEELVRQLEACRQPHTCPHGRPTMVHLSAGQLEREFGRR